MGRSPQPIGEAMEAKESRRGRFPFYDELRIIIRREARKEAYELLKEYLPTARKRNGSRVQEVVKKAVDPEKVRTVIPRWSPRSMALHRARLGLNRIQYAQLMGVSAVTIFMWETGRNHPKPEMVARFRNLEEGRSLAERQAVAVPRGSAAAEAAPPVERAPYGSRSSESRKIQARAYMTRKRAELLAKGICPICWKQPVREGLKSCETCGAKTAARSRRDYAARAARQAQAHVPQA